MLQIFQEVKKKKRKKHLFVANKRINHVGGNFPLFLSSRRRWRRAGPWPPGSTGTSRTSGAPAGTRPTSSPTPWCWSSAGSWRKQSGCRGRGRTSTGAWRPGWITAGWPARLAPPLTSAPERGWPWRTSAPRCCPPAAAWSSSSKGVKKMPQNFTTAFFFFFNCKINKHSEI